MYLFCLFSCTVRIPDPEMDDTEPCPDDLKTYFEASYKCIPGESPNLLHSCLSKISS